MTINLLKLNEVTHLLIVENEEKKGKFLLGSWGGIRLGEKHASTPIGGSDGLSIKEMNDALKLSMTVAREGDDDAYKLWQRRPASAGGIDPGYRDGEVCEWEAIGGG